MEIVVIRLLLIIITCEAIVNLIFNGSVLQPLREWLIKRTSVLSVRGDHLLSCKLCTSFWVGTLGVIFFMFFDIIFVKVIVLSLVIHRLSNHFHLIFSLLRDVQLDIRVRRNKCTMSQ